MFDKLLRRRIAFEAARLLHSGQEADYVRAKRRAVRKIGCRFRLKELPSNREVQTQLDQLDQLENGGLPQTDLRTLRLEALRWMRRLRGFRPQLVGDVGAGRSGRDVRIDIDLVAADLPAVLQVLRGAPVTSYVTEESLSVSGIGAQIYVDGPIPLKLTVRLPQQPRDGEPMRPPTPALALEELEHALGDGRESAELDLELDGIDPRTDRFEQYRVLLAQIEEVQQDPSSHPEGDALFHSLQVFELALAERPFDEEFLTAALLHDVGKAVSLKNAPAETIRLLAGIVTHRTLALIAGLADVPSYQLRRLSAKRCRELETAADFPEMLLLNQLNAAGRRPGVATCSLAEALDYLRRLDAESPEGE